MHSHIVVGLAFGDEGKGSWVDHLCRLHNIKTVVRFNGGAQALHHVTTEAGTVHGFSQFGSHSFIPGAKTLLSRFMLIEPMQLMFETKELVDKGVSAPLKRLYISSEAPIIPFTNVLLNRIMETARGSERHGSCGLGIGLTQRDIADGKKPVIRAGDLANRLTLTAKLRDHLALTQAEARKWEQAAGSEAYRYLYNNFEELLYKYVDVYTELSRSATVVPEATFLSLIRRMPVVFEGAQGALLDEFQGTFPYCTRSVTTAQNALTLLSDAGYTGEVTRHGLLRAYGTRHGAGPFVTEDAALKVPTCDNSTGEWQGTFRTGWFDAVATRSALAFSAVDELVLTNLDRLDGAPHLKVATEYEGITCDFYDKEKHQLKLVNDYDASRRRTEALFGAQPVYQTVSGFTDGSDPQHEEYIRFIEHELGQEVTALSRSKGHQKTQRA